MANQWTAEQAQVIETRKRNLLVSAAAGSGKTAVLVERIIRMITDAEHPVDIDKLLVMTFTNAAAAEMRERVEAALGKRLDENPGDKNLERQSMLIHHAKITTIDSFCLGLLREHFHKLDLDPAFRVADEGELLLIQSDVMKDLLEEYYSREDPRFLNFVDIYASGRTDGGLADYILKVFRFSQSNPWPGEWIAACKKELSLTGEDAKKKVDETAWMQFMIEDVKKQAGEFVKALKEALELSREEDGPNSYEPTLAEDLAAMEGLLQVSGYEEFAKKLSSIEFGRLSAARKKTVDPEKKDLAAALRNQAKDGIKKMKAMYLPTDPDGIFADLDACREPILMLLELAEEFAARFAEAKEEKDLVDFNDLEHFALEILTDGKKDHSPGAVADELSGIYEEILVDEYQDSNEVQETLIRCISRERFGHPNVFMVGDVKQSIYKFRLAKPELFLEKYESYPKEDGLYQKIELHKNFRSRPEVLASINHVFYRIMTRSLGNIAYTDEVALYPGRDFPSTPDKEQSKTEVLLLNTGEEFFAGMDEEKADVTAKEAEAKMIAAKIREITDPQTGMKLFNEKSGNWEPVKKKDIVILLRSLSGWTEEFLSVLGGEGIPAFAESRTGYFTAMEVETVLNLLSLIDNPMQDIPLAGVLKSPIVQMTDRELAIVAAAFKRNPDKGMDGGFYGAVRHFLEHHEDPKDPVYRKLADFWSILLKLRKEALFLSVPKLIGRIFDLTGFDQYAAAMPAGRVRQANLDMLIQKAEDYEKTSYQGLFDFIRYIEKLKKYDTDFGEASRIGENDDAVRIMSIHKSKGLEFPVVFLAGCGKKFNRQDANGRILIDEKLGIGVDFFDPKRKIKAPTLKKNVLARRSVLESMGEELRVLYVAMTRAKEKLFITAADKYLDNKLEKWKNLPEGRGLPFTVLSAANSYLDWILMAADGENDLLRVKIIPVSELVLQETKKQEEKLKLDVTLASLRETDGAVEESLMTRSYPYEADLTLRAKTSVSKLKEKEIEKSMKAEKGKKETLENTPEEIPEEAKNPKTAKMVLSGADRGTAYHRVLELIPFQNIAIGSELSDIKRELQTIQEKKEMDPKALDVVYPGVLKKFFASEIGRRMCRADQKGLLEKESQFVVGIPANELYETESRELILLQGVIDAWFEEEDGLVIVDYKTDHAKEGEEEILLARYQLQLQCYTKALEQLTKKKVREAILYSLTLQKGLSIPLQ